MKIWFQANERYPDYECAVDIPEWALDLYPAEIIEVPDDLFSRYIKARDEYDQVQNELSKIRHSNI